MIGRALVLAAALAAAAAPVAQARPSVVVQAGATAVNQVEVMHVQFECAASHAGLPTVRLRRCSFGPIYADTGDCYECLQPPVVVAGDSGNLAVGLPYDLCVTAETFGAAGTQSVTRCAPFSYLTNSAVIAG